jgi:hypothetical protein
MPERQEDKREESLLLHLKVYLRSVEVGDNTEERSKGKIRGDYV